MLCGYKVVLQGKRRQKSVVFRSKKNLQYYGISAKSNYSFEKSSLWLTRKLTGDHNLEFVAWTMLIMNPGWSAEYDLEVAQTTAPLDKDDDP